jgi:hypothetical protein
MVDMPPAMNDGVTRTPVAAAEKRNKSPFVKSHIYVVISSMDGTQILMATKFKKGTCTYFQSDTLSGKTWGFIYKNHPHTGTNFAIYPSKAGHEVRESYYVFPWKIF